MRHVRRVRSQEPHCCRHDQTRLAAGRKKGGVNTPTNASAPRESTATDTKGEAPCFTVPKPKLLQQIHREAKKYITQAQKKTAFRCRGNKWLWCAAVRASHPSLIKRHRTTTHRDDSVQWRRLSSTHKAAITFHPVIAQIYAPSMHCQQRREGHGRGLSRPSSFRPQQILSILLLATPWVPRNAVKQSRVYGSPQCVGRSWQSPTLTPPHMSSSTTFPHTKGQRHEEKAAAQRTQKHRHPRRTARKSHAHSTPTAATRGTGRIQVHGAAALLPSAPTDWNCAPTAGCGGRRHTSTVRHSAHHLLPPKCTRQAGARRLVSLLPSQRQKQKVFAGHQCL
ncbi:hypothetical protein MOQ_002423 [Trypanosoma cruzi marinkellei]|uniref:Uncharacterized protein n=1 Tax=Trypanosoma cruzi marinkellei TaxID=85056 RepID=K2N779_TRYCR|nr:hypothetical protein MOQ_002423 [Trypanosoma cruzi marinkellei]